MRGVLGLTVALMMVMPGIALAQPPRQPIVELGAQVTGDSGPVGRALRLTVPLKRRAAIEVTARGQNSDDIQESPDMQARSEWWTSEREFSVHWRQTVFASGRLRIFGVLGGGRNRVKTGFFRVVQGRVEANDGSEVSEFVAHFGPALQVELARWLALRFDLQGVVGQRDSGVRGMVGAVIPIPRIGTGDQPGQSTPPPAGWERVKPGREVWVTTNSGSLVYGKVAAISDSSLSIREQDREVTIRLDEVRLVEGKDSKKNGLVIGGASAAVVGGLFFAGLATACEAGQGCSGDTGGAFLGGAILVGAAGGLLGMMVDGLISGRQTLFGGSTTVVTPVITPTTKAVNLAIRWR